MGCSTCGTVAGVRQQQTNGASARAATGKTVIVTNAAQQAVPYRMEFGGQVQSFGGLERDEVPENDVVEAEVSPGHPIGEADQATGPGPVRVTNLGNAGTIIVDADGESQGSLASGESLLVRDRWVELSADDKKVIGGGIASAAIAVAVTSLL